MDAVKVLLVTFYFPPAGGAGVPRLLKLAEHLPELGIETHVLAPDDPKWLHVDETLEPPPAAIVHRAKNLGPRSRKPAEDLAAAHGIARLGVRAQLLFRGLLVPDASVVWAATAAPAAARLVRKEGIDVVVTTSPPGSVHLVGSFVRRFTRARWVADLRDSIALHPHRRRQIRGEGALARHVARARRRRCGRLRRHCGRDAVAGTAAAPAGDRQRLRLRGLRGPRVPARRAAA